MIKERKLENKLILMNERYNIVLKGVSKFIYELSQINMQINEIINKVESKYDIEHDLAKKDVESTIANLEKLGFIKKSGIKVEDNNNVCSEINYSEFNKEYNGLFKVVFEMTYSCNNKCRYCYNGEFHAQEELKKEEYFRLIDECEQMGVTLLSFTGGEPFMKKDIMDILEYANNKKFKIVIQTNGTLITENIAKVLSGFEDIKVAITIHSQSSEIHDNFTRCKGSFNKAILGIQNLRRYDIPVLIRNVITKENFNNVEEYINFGKKLGVKVNMTPTIYNSVDDKNKNENIRLSTNEVIKLIETNIYKPMHDPCGAAREKIIISPFGKVYPCTFVHNEIGDIKYNTIMEIIKSPFTKKIAELYDMPEKCLNCDMQIYCPRCPANVAQGKGDFKAINEFDCIYANTRKKIVSKENG